ncbi:hypothetical protein [Domibacillus sp. 8LH]|uniref:hypothetical protein n=1 Tax=Domibacillus sp. 8LH TaxID=3073900 RepID=UPI00319DB776
MRFYHFVGRASVSLSCAILSNRTGGGRAKTPTGQVGSAPAPWKAKLCARRLISSYSNHPHSLYE